MSDTPEKITIPSKQWVNLYAESGIAVGTAITVHNVGHNQVSLTVKAAEPTNLMAALPISFSNHLTNETGDSGAWAYSIGGSSVIVFEA